MVNEFFFSLFIFPVFPISTICCSPLSQSVSISGSQPFRWFDAPQNKYCVHRNCIKFTITIFHAHEHSARTFSTVIDLIYVSNHPRVFSIYCWTSFFFVLHSSSSLASSLLVGNMQKAHHFYTHTHPHAFNE